MRPRAAWTVAISVVAVAAVIGVAAVMTSAARDAPEVAPAASASTRPTPTATRTPSPTLTPTATPTPTARPGTVLVDRKNDGSVRMLVAGDSLTAGFFATTKDRGFIRLVADDIGSVDVTGAAQAQQTLSTVAAVTDVPSDVGVAVVELGTNDVGVPTPLADFEQQYASLLDRIRSTSPKAGLLCLGTWTADGAAYDEVIARSCAARAGVYVSLAEAFATADFHGPAGRETFAGAGDEFHPNDAGHRAIADAVLAALTH
ncbi:SGNH/GDSL hydrolase family protein [Microbacterium sp. BWR-S6Y]|uniref:SGNH/GDSL hydrolase family protein n=1 Tax=Microbacterium sp. BWR-S6Y TaxID=3232073 RepID=UPI003526E0AC